ncbi:MAG: OmpA family protein [Deltaproteobacteria bacterium]|nr:OmpA family protein [Deltaproteobacteria bacterium]
MKTSLFRTAQALGRLRSALCLPLFLPLCLPFAFALTLAVSGEARAGDFDKDGVDDLMDDCPTDPGRPEFSGCRGAHLPGATTTVAAKSDRVVVDKKKAIIEIKDNIEFGLGSATIAEKSWPILAAIADQIKALPANKSVLIEGHTDDLGPRSVNVALSRRRAEGIIAHLVRAGVARERLKAAGFGPDRPIVPNDSDQARAKNRRVEFHIVDAR